MHGLGTLVVLNAAASIRPGITVRERRANPPREGTVKLVDSTTALVAWKDGSTTNILRTSLDPIEK